MQTECLLFSGRRGLDDQAVRNSILRIPEVSRRIKEAQRIIDEHSNESLHLDLYSFLLAGDDEFNDNPRLKALISATVQIGLFDRYVKYRSRPQFMVGRLNDTSAMKVCAGKQSFDSFITQSDYFNEINDVAALPTTMTKLAGTRLEEFGVFRWDADGFYCDHIVESKEPEKIVEELSLENFINQCIHIGPGTASGTTIVSTINSIDVDPILNSFWRTA